MEELTYSEQLRHPLWQKKRLEVLEAAEFKCERCYDGESQLHVHHKQYFKGRKPWEYDAKELMAVCHSCHEEADKERVRVRQVLAYLRADGPASTAEAISLLCGWANAVVPKEISLQAYEEMPYPFWVGVIADVVSMQCLGLPLIEKLARRLNDVEYRERFRELLNQFASSE